MRLTGNNPGVTGQSTRGTYTRLNDNITVIRNCREVSMVEITSMKADDLHGCKITICGLEVTVNKQPGYTRFGVSDQHLDFQGSVPAAYALQSIYRIFFGPVFECGGLLRQD